MSCSKCYSTQQVHVHILHGNACGAFVLLASVASQCSMHTPQVMQHGRGHGLVAIAACGHIHHRTQSGTCFGHPRHVVADGSARNDVTQCSIYMGQRSCRANSVKARVAAVLAASINAKSSAASSKARAATAAKGEAASAEAPKGESADALVAITPTEPPVTTDEIEQAVRSLRLPSPHCRSSTYLYTRQSSVL